MVDLDIHAIMAAIAKFHPIHESEAHFRVALGREIHRRHPKYFIAMECPLPELQKEEKMDICLESQDDQLLTGIELKYFALKWSGTVNGVHYNFGEKARDMTRFGFFADIVRLEQLVFSRDDVTGYAIFLSNDKHFWLRREELPRRSKEKTDDREFYIHEKIRASGRHSWHGNKKAKRKNPFLDLRGDYEMKWTDYPCSPPTNLNPFRYLVVRIHQP